MKLMLNCPKCKGQMEEGFVVDYAGNFPQVSEWSAESPKMGWFGFGVDVKGVRKITSYRCTSCGYLESYAK